MPSTMSRLGALARTLLVAAAFAIALCAALAVALPASGTTSSPTAEAVPTDEPAEPRWSVAPADESGPDGRRVVEHELDPGETVEDRFAVHNVGDEEVTFQLTAADGFYTRTGRFDILAGDQESVAAGTWISLPESVTIGPGETEVIDFSVTVPERAEPGDHAAGITASVLSVQSAEDGTSVGVESRIGFRVLTRVTGEITPAASVQNVNGEYDLSWNPLRPGETTVTFEVVNEGNTRLLAEGTVSAGGQNVEFPLEGENRQELLPGDTREMSFRVDGVWPLFAVPVAVSFAPEVVTADGATSTLEPVVAETTVWAIPWPHLGIVAGIALIVIAIMSGRTRSRRKLDALLAEAREQGRKSAQEKVETS
ncbi:COG1470 family protein [Georgenia wangjunii]|uniref:COG1470 family protein n=1 Tax=Georgenia wangjunii TaxID=3117730 RepID=UPI002F25EF3C